MNYTEKHDPDCGDVMSVEDFLKRVKNGSFNDCDGFGHPSNGTHLDPGIMVYPSTIYRIPKESTHIVWFNK